MVVLYGGLRFPNRKLKFESKHQSKNNAYGHTVGFCEGVIVDIPRGKEKMKVYNATLAHKTQHSFNNNLKTVQVSILGCLFFENF